MDIKKKLETNNQTIKIVAEHLLTKAETDKDLLRAIEDKEDRTILDCWKYICECARKRLNGQSGALQDEEVFGYAEEYFKLEEIETFKPVKAEKTEEKEPEKEKVPEVKQPEPKKKEVKETVKEIIPKPTKKSKKKKANEIAENQISFF